MGRLVALASRGSLLDPPGGGCLGNRPLEFQRRDLKDLILSLVSSGRWAAPMRK